MLEVAVPTLCPASLPPETCSPVAQNCTAGDSLAPVSPAPACRGVPPGSGEWCSPAECGPGRRPGRISPRILSCELGFDGEIIGDHKAREQGNDQENGF